MMGSDHLPPPPSAAADLAALLVLVNLLADPAAAAARITALRDAVDRFNSAKADAEKANSKQMLAAHRDEIAAGRADHDAQLKAERQAFEQERTRAMEEIRRRNEESKRIFKAAEIDKQLADELRADAESRLSKIREAATGMSRGSQ